MMRISFASSKFYFPRMTFAVAIVNYDYANGVRFGRLITKRSCIAASY
jgi:hypothetical protein